MNPQEHEQLALLAGVCTDLEEVDLDLIANALERDYLQSDTPEIVNRFWDLSNRIKDTRRALREFDLVMERQAFIESVDKLENEVRRVLRRAA